MEPKEICKKIEPGRCLFCGGKTRVIEHGYGDMIAYSIKCEN